MGSHDDARDVLEGSNPVERALRDELLLLAPRVRKPPTTADNHKQPRVSMLPAQRSDDHHVTSHLSSHGKETMVMGEVKWGLRACLRVGPGESALTVTL